MAPKAARLILVSLLALPAALATQRPTALPDSPSAMQSAEGPSIATVPFGVGEEMLYDLKIRRWPFGGSGEASLRIEAIDTIRGEPAYRLAFAYRGGLTIFKMDNRDRSWLDVDELFSHRFEQKHEETRHSRDRTYEFLPEEMRYRNLANPADSGTLATPFPLDDVSFFYHIRLLPLEVGKEFTEPRYYKEDGNPVTVRVLRAERIRVPAGEFDALVIQPVIRTDGMFKEGGEAEIWISNDPRRILLKLFVKANLGVSLNMELREYRGPR
jgi:hypothetical protein